MRKSTFISVLLGLCLVACNSEFEKIRTGGNAEQIYEKAMEYYDAGDYLKAQTLYELILNSFRGTAKAEDLAFKYAYTHYYQGSYLLSAHYFENFSNTYTSSEKREEADYMIAYSNYLLSPTFRLDQQNTTKAIEQFQLFINTYPNSDRVATSNELIEEMRKKLETKAFAQGKLYYDLKAYNASIHSFENLLKDFPETEDAEEIRFLILKASFLFAENSFFERQAERYETAMGKYADFQKKFPSSKYMPEAREMLNQTRAKLKIHTQDERYQVTSAGL